MAKGKYPNIAIFAPLYPPAFLGGGPIRTLSAMVAAARDPDAFFVLSSDRDLGAFERLPVHRNCWSTPSLAHVYYVSDDNLIQYVRGLLAIRRVQPALIYLNSVFNLKYSLVAQLLRPLGFWRNAQILVAPRGELSAGALALKSRKKRLFLRGYVALGLHRYVNWHASSELEATEIRKSFGLEATVFVRENETELPRSAELPEPAESGRLRLIFLSRLSRKKGLRLLLEALASVTEEVDLEIFGDPAEDPKYVAECRVRAGTLAANVRVSFCGSVVPERVRQQFLQNDVFVFPTAGENFGHVIAEALSASCPVLLQDVTPWTSRISNGGGFVIKDPSPITWALAIDRLAKCTGSERRALREDAARAYDQWMAEDHGPSVFDLLIAEHQFVS